MFLLLSLAAIPCFQSSSEVPDDWEMIAETPIPPPSVLVDAFLFVTQLPLDDAQPDADAFLVSELDHDWPDADQPSQEAPVAQQAPPSSPLEELAKRQVFSDSEESAAESTVLGDSGNSDETESTHSSEGGATEDQSATETDDPSSRDSVFERLKRRLPRSSSFRFNRASLFRSSKSLPPPSSEPSPPTRRASWRERLQAQGLTAAFT